MSPIPNHEPGYFVFIDKGQGKINYDDLTIAFFSIYQSIYLSIYWNRTSISLEGLFVVLIFCSRMLKFKKAVSRYKKAIT